MTKLFASRLDDIIDWLRDWDWDFSELLGAMLETVQFWFSVYGWPAYLAVGLVILAILLSWDLTHNVTTQILSGTYRAVVFYTLSLATLVLALVARTTASMAIARGRDAVRAVQSQYQRRPSSG